MKTYAAILLVLTSLTLSANAQKLSVGMLGGVNGNNSVSQGIERNEYYEFDRKGTINAAYGVSISTVLFKHIRVGAIGYNTKHIEKRKTTVIKEVPNPSIFAPVNKVGGVTIDYYSYGSGVWYTMLTVDYLFNYGIVHPFVGGGAGYMIPTKDEGKKKAREKSLTYSARVGAVVDIPKTRLGVTALFSYGVLTKIYGRQVNNYSAMVGVSYRIVK